MGVLPNSGGEVCVGVSNLRSGYVTRAVTLHSGALIDVPTTGYGTNNCKRQAMLTNELERNMFYRLQNM